MTIGNVGRALTSARTSRASPATRCRGDEIAVSVALAAERLLGPRALVSFGGGGGGGGGFLGNKEKGSVMLCS